MTSTELIKPQDIRAALLHGKVLEVVPVDDVQADIVQRILGAKTIEDAARDFSAIPMEQVEGVALDITGLAWMQSSYEEGSPVYALVRARANNAPDEEVFSIGGRSVMAFLLWCQENKAMPFKATFIKKGSKANPERKFWTVKLV